MIRFFLYKTIADTPSEHASIDEAMNYLLKMNQMTANPRDPNFQNIAARIPSIGYMRLQALDEETGQSTLVTMRAAVNSLRSHHATIELMSKIIKQLGQENLESSAIW